MLTTRGPGDRSDSTASDVDEYSIEQQLSFLPLDPAWESEHARLPKRGDHFAGHTIASQNYGLIDLRATAHALRCRDERIAALSTAYEAAKTKIHELTLERDAHQVRAERYRAIVCAQSIWLHKEWGLRPEWSVTDAHKSMKDYVAEAGQNNTEANTALKTMMARYGPPGHSQTVPRAAR